MVKLGLVKCHCAIYDEMWKSMTFVSEILEFSVCKLIFEICIFSSLEYEKMKNKGRN